MSVPSGGEDSAAPTVYVEAGRKDKVEDFAEKLEAFPPSKYAKLDEVPYARMDASALLSNIAGDDDELLCDDVPLFPLEVVSLPP